MTVNEEVNAELREDRDPRPSKPSSIYFALLAHPTVQAVRFLSKLCLAWFVSTGDFGEVMLAGLILFGASHVAIFGLDEALIYARELDLHLWHRMRRLQNALGILLATLAALAGLALQNLPGHPLLGEMMLVLAPMVWCANFSVLPTALLVRERMYSRIFQVDLWCVVALSLTTIGCALLGAGPWSLVAGWYANAIVAVVASWHFARSLVPREQSESADWNQMRRYGAHLTGAAVLAYIGERLDSFSVGFFLGRTALGLYEFALHLSQVGQNYTASLVERFLFPTLAAHHRESSLENGYRRALHFTLLFVLPAHILVAVLARPLLRVLAPDPWQPAAPLLGWLALASAARCVDMVAVSALKASGQSHRVFRLGILRLGRWLLHSRSVLRTECWPLPAL